MSERQRKKSPLKQGGTGKGKTRKVPPGKSFAAPSPEKALPLLGIVRRAGKLALGMDPAIEAMRKKEAELLLLSPELSPRSRKKIQEEAERYGADRMEIPFGMDAICAALGKRSGIIAVCDGGFAGKLKELLASAEQTGILPGKQGDAHAERQEPHGGAPDTQETEEESHL